MRAVVLQHRSPLDPPHIKHVLDAPCTVREYLDREGIDEFPVMTVCLVNGEPWFRSQWHGYIPDNGVVAFVGFPAGGPGGGKQILTAVLMVALVAAAVWSGGALAPLLPGATATTAGATAGGGLLLVDGLSTLGVIYSGVITSTILIGGGYLINTLLPTPRTDKPKDLQPSYDLSAQNNLPRLGEPIPVQVGRFRAVPDYAEPPWREFLGGEADDPQASGAKFKSQQKLYQVLCLGQGYFDVEDIRVGSYSLLGREDIQHEILDPGQPITIVPAAVVPWFPASGVSAELFSPNEWVEVAGQGLRGQIQPVATDPETPANKVPTTFYTATGGTSTTITLAGAGWATNEHAGRQCYVGDDTDFFVSGGKAHQTNHNPTWNGTNVSNGWDNANATPDDPENGWTFRLVHPSRLRTIISNNATTLTFEKAYTGTFVPAIGTKFHIRDDYYPAAAGPSGNVSGKGAGFYINPIDVGSDFKFTKVAFDFQGPPLFRLNAEGSLYRCAIGLIIECRKLKDNLDEPDADPQYGLWHPVAPLYENWQRIDNQLGGGGWWEGLIGGRQDAGNGVCVTRQCNVVFYGPPSRTAPLQASLEYTLPVKGRWEFRLRRSTYKWKDERTSNQIVLTSVRAFVRDDRSYEDVTIVAVVTTGTQATLDTNRGNIAVISTAKKPLYSPGYSGSALPANSFRVYNDSDKVEVTLPDHRLVVGQPVTIANMSGSIGGISIANLTGVREVFEVISPSVFSYTAGARGTGSVTGPSTPIATVTAAPYWTTSHSNPAKRYLPTANPAQCWLAEATNMLYGGRVPTSKLDFDEVTRLVGTYISRSDECNGRFESRRSMREALDQIARTGRAKTVYAHGLLSLSRDEPRTIASAAYTTQNTRDISRRAIGQRADAANAIRARIFSRETWTEMPVEAVITGVTPTRWADREYFLITDPQHAHREARYDLYSDRYRRIFGTIAAEAEGYIPLYGNLVNVADRDIAWGSSGEVVAYNSSTHDVTAELELEWMDGPELLTDPSILTNTSEWQAVGTSTTLSKPTDDGDGGYLSINANAAADTQAMAQMAAVLPNFAQGTKYRIKAKIKARSVGAVGRVLSLQIRESGGATATESSIGALDVPLTSSWQEIDTIMEIRRADRTAARFRLGVTTTWVAQASDLYGVDYVHIALAAESVQHVAALIKDDGSRDGPYTVTKVSDLQFRLPGGLTWTPTTTRELRERTRFLFGRADVWAKEMIVQSINPQGGLNYEVTVVQEDSRVHSADGITYIPPDVTDAPKIPVAPTVRFVRIYEAGASDVRRMHVSWSDAPGAGYYEVEVGGICHLRRVKLLVGLVVGTFTADEQLEVFGGAPVGSKIDAISTTFGSGIVTVTHAGTTFQTGDRIFIVNAPQNGVGGIIAADLNGRHVVLTANANQYTFNTNATATAADGKGCPNMLVYAETGAEGNVYRDTPNGSPYFYYYLIPTLADQRGLQGELTGGPIPEIKRTNIIYGFTSRAFAVAEFDADVAEGFWTRVGETRETFVDTDMLISDVNLYDSNDPLGDNITEIVTARVRGVGLLQGPWCYAAIKPRANNAQSVAFDATGRPMMETPIGQTFRLMGYIDVQAGTGLVVKLGYLPLGLRCIVDYLSFHVDLGFNTAGAKLIIGTQDDADRYIKDVPVTSNGFRGEVSLHSDYTAYQGVSFGFSLLPSGDGAVYAVITGAGITVGRAYVSLQFAIVPSQAVGADPLPPDLWSRR